MYPIQGFYLQLYFAVFLKLVINHLLYINPWIHQYDTASNHSHAPVIHKALLFILHRSLALRILEERINVNFLDLQTRYASWIQGCLFLSSVHSCTFRDIFALRTFWKLKTQKFVTCLFAIWFLSPENDSAIRTLRSVFSMFYKYRSRKVWLATPTIMIFTIFQFYELQVFFRARGQSVWYRRPPVK